MLQKSTGTATVACGDLQQLPATAWRGQKKVHFTRITCRKTTETTDPPPPPPRPSWTGTTCLCHLYRTPPPPPNHHGLEQLVSATCTGPPPLPRPSWTGTTCLCPLYRTPPPPPPHTHTPHFLWQHKVCPGSQALPSDKSLPLTNRSATLFFPFPSLATLQNDRMVNILTVATTGIRRTCFVSEFYEKETNKKLNLDWFWYLSHSDLHNCVKNSPLQTTPPQVISHFLPFVPPVHFFCAPVCAWVWCARNILI